MSHSSVDSDFVAIYAPLYHSTPVTTSREEIDEHEQEKSSLLTASYGFRSMTASAFVDLLESLQVSSIITTQPQRGGEPLIVGRGGFGVVTYDQIHKVDESAPIAVAVKALPPISGSSASLRQFESIPTDIIAQAYLEVCILKHPLLATHDNIVTLFGISSSDLARKDDALALSCIFEYADLGSLDLYLDTYTSHLEWSVKLGFLTDIANGLSAIHSCGIVHNDVKCGNVLLFTSPLRKSNIIAKVADFGCSVPLAGIKEIRRAAGSRLFAPPEAYSIDSLVYPSRDVYSFGLIILHVAREFRPFYGETPETIWKTKNDQNMMHNYIDNFLASSQTPVEIRDMVLEVVQKEPNKRLAMGRLFGQRYPLTTDFGAYIPKRFPT
jgi:serine/threonine protein kinase